MVLYHFLLDAAGEDPDLPALDVMGRPVSFAELADEAKQVAAGLRKLGISPGESVAVMLPNLREFVTCLYGALLGGYTFVPLNVMLRRPEIAYVATDSRIRVLVTYEGFADEVRAAVADLTDPPVVFVVGQPGPGEKSYAQLLSTVDASFRPADATSDSVIMTLYTSGTTGRPKGAQLTNGNVTSNLDMFEHVLPPQPGDRMLCVLPLFHVFALNGLLNAAIRQRTTLVVQPRFEVEETMRSLCQDGVTTFAGVPTMYFYLLKHPQFREATFPALRYCISGGAAMPLEVMTEFEKITGVPIYEGYGLTETTVSVCLNRPGERKVGSIGQPFDEVDLKIVDEHDVELPDGEIGELIVRGPNVMRGYLNKPDATAEAMKGGYLHTGDLAYRDDDGFLFIVDRKKDMIIKGGFNIYPREIEEVIYQLPEVSEVAVIGVFDEAKGEVIRAVIALKGGMSLSAAQLEAHLEPRLSKYKLPQQYVFLDELPKGATGKILKRELRDAAERWNRDRARSQQGD